MKVTIPEISWHNRDPVLALDVQPSPPDGIYRLATAGTDTHVVIWQLKILDNGGVSVEALSDLTRHSRAVNAVRFSPNGEFLATADDEAAIILWKKQVETDIFTEDSEKENKEHWTLHKMLRGHLEDVYDICWSACSAYLITGSVDNSAILWDVAKGKNMGLLNDHKGFVQGVAWDPMGQYVATLCSDRNCRIYNISNKKIAARVHKATLPLTDAEDKVVEKETRLFHDDTLKSFCRRLSFSPDGEILLAPSGILEEESGKTSNVTYVFSRHMLNKPVLYLPTKDKYTLAVRFCPMLFELKPLMPEHQPEDAEGGESLEEWERYANLFRLPYRMVFAVATQNAVVLYDTQQSVPFAKVSNIHYTRLSDVAWSSDGRLLVVSSTDGYCSLVSFAEGELGTPYTKQITDTLKKPLGLSPNPLKSSSRSTSPSMSPRTASPHAKVEGAATTPSTKHNDKKPQPMETSTDTHKTQSEKRMEEEDTKDKDPPPANKPSIAVKSKGGKRVSLITLSGPHRNDENNSPAAKTTAHANAEQEEEMEVDEDTKMKFEGEDTTPKKGARTPPAKTPTGGTKTPRRVPLIMLSSPKGKKNEAR